MLRRLRHYLILSTLLMEVSPGIYAADIKILKPVIIELINRHCLSPKPNPKILPVLEYDCSEKYEDADDYEQSMDYSLRLLPLLVHDFNKDGIQDLALEVASMGPLGGSVTTNNTVYYLLLDKHQNIINSHKILLYAPFSENIVEYSVTG